MPSIAKLGHIALVSENIEQSIAFWRDIVGLEEIERHDDTVFLRAWGDWEHHTLSLREGPTSVDHIAFRAGATEDVRAYADQLSATGVETQWVEAGEERGQGEAVRFLLPGGNHPLEIYFDVEKPEAPAERRSRLKNQTAKSWARGISPRSIDHVNLWSPDATTPRAFFEEQLGFKAREEIVHSQAGLLGSWLSVTSLAHDVALMGSDPAQGDARLHHIAYYLDNWQDVLRAADICREHDVQIDIGPGRHGISQALFCYVRDPGSGHRLELFSGGYHIYDPDWETVTWSEDELEAGLIWWGERYTPGSGHAIEETTPCHPAVATA
jgi:catechol 2,3-dioxygenase